MNQAVEQIIYNALNKNERVTGIGSSATANEIIKGVKSHYQAGSESEKQSIIQRLNKLKV